MAVQSKNTEEVKAILLRNGFTETQLESVSFSFEDATGGKEGGKGKASIKSFSWSITVKCCPPQIIIKSGNDEPCVFPKARNAVFLTGEV